MNNLIRDSVRALEAYSPGEQINDSNIVKLNTNENPYLPSPDVQDILSMIDISMLSKYPDPNCIELRKVIAELHKCSTDEVFIGNGSDEVLALALRAFVERNESAAYLKPSYSLYSVLLDIEDIQKNEVSLNDRFEADISSNISEKLFFLANPNAPTGLSISKKSILKFINKFKGVLLIDEAYADFSNQNCIDLALDYPNILVSRSLSKSYSLAGIRCGYCIGNVELINALYKIKDSYNISYITQEIARVALLDQDTMRANSQAIIETRELTKEKLSELGLYVLNSETNFLWVKPISISANELFIKLRNKNILVRYFDSLETKDYLRITIGTAPQMFTLIDAVSDIINSD